MERQAKRVGIYCRVSTGEQDTGRQETELRAFAAARGWDVVALVVEVESGGKDRRPERAKLLDMAKRRLLDVVLVQDVDRWGRSTVDIVTTVHNLHALGVDFVILGFVDTTTPEGELMLTQMAGFAQFERRQIQKRVRSGLAHARAKGVKLGRPRAKHPKHGEIIRLLVEGLSYRTVAARLKVGLATVNRAVRAWEKDNEGDPERAAREAGAAAVERIMQLWAGGRVDR